MLADLSKPIRTMAAGNVCYSPTKSTTSKKGNENVADNSGAKSSSEKKHVADTENV